MTHYQRYNFCTLFDSYYLTRGIALYRSLEIYCVNFHLYIFAFDDNSFKELNELNLTNATIISLGNFESPELLFAKAGRTFAEYCWTCTASTIWYSINKYELDNCTYLDADILFFSTPQPIFDEIGKSSIGITKHNFSKDWKESDIYGRYCVQFVFFRNDKYGMEALNWWRLKCVEWCFAKLEDTRYGDQKYLDYFEEKFSNVCVIENIGSGVAPWNINNYSIIEKVKSGNISLQTYSGLSGQLIFYHFQGLKMTEMDKYIYCEASIGAIPKKALQYVYDPYIRTLYQLKFLLKNEKFLDKPIIFDRRFTIKLGFAIRQMLKQFKLMRVLYYAFKRNRYDRPKNIG